MRISCNGEIEKHCNFQKGEPDALRAGMFVVKYFGGKIMIYVNNECEVDSIS